MTLNVWLNVDLLCMAWIDLKKRGFDTVSTLSDTFLSQMFSLKRAESNCKTSYVDYFADTQLPRLSHAFWISLKSSHKYAHRHTAGIWLQLYKAETHMLDYHWENCLCLCVFFWVYTHNRPCLCENACGCGLGANPQSAFRSSNTSLLFLFPSFLEAALLSLMWWKTRTVNSYTPTWWRTNKEIYVSVTLNGRCWF